MGVVWFVLCCDRCSTCAQTLHCLPAYLNVACVSMKSIFVLCQSTLSVIIFQMIISQYLEIGHNCYNWIAHQLHIGTTYVITVVVEVQF